MSPDVPSWSLVPRCEYPLHLQERKSHVDLVPPSLPVPQVWEFQLPAPQGSRGLHTTLVWEQLRIFPSLGWQRCRGSNPQVTPIEGGSRISVLEVRFPQPSSRQICWPRFPRCAAPESHRSHHCPAWNTWMSPSHGVGPAASLRRACGWEPVGEGLDPQGGVRPMGRGEIHKEREQIHG